MIAAGVADRPDQPRASAGSGASASSMALDLAAAQADRVDRRHRPAAARPRPASRGGRHRWTPGRWRPRSMMLTAPAGGLSGWIAARTAGSSVSRCGRRRRQRVVEHRGDGDEQQRQDERLAHAADGVVDGRPDARVAHRHGRHERGRQRRHHERDADREQERGRAATSIHDVPWRQQPIASPISSSQGAESAGMRASQSSARPPSAAAPRPGTASARCAPPARPRAWSRASGRCPPAGPTAADASAV